MSIPDALDLQDSIDFFNEFENELQNASNSAHHHVTLKDYNYFNAGAQKQYVVCRPLGSGGNLNPWVYEASTQAWLENADWDPVRNQIDMSKVPAHAAPPGGAQAGACTGCGASFATLGGMIPQFCPSCGTPVSNHPHFPQGNPMPQPVAPGGVSVQGPPTASNTSIRMTGKQEEKVIIPESLGKGDSKKQEQEWLDKLLATADEPTTQEEPKADA
jgi:hypothetical protein